MNLVRLLAAVFFLVPTAAFAQLTCKQPPASIVSWWDGEGDASDIIGTNHGSLENGATATRAGKVGNAFGFDGINDFVRIPNSVSLNPSTQFALESWVQGDPSNPMNGCCQGLVTTDFYGVEGFDSSRGVGVFISTDGGTTFPNANTVSSNTGFGLVPGQWHHIAATYDGNLLAQYVDGRLRAAVTVSGNIPAMAFTSFLSFGSEDGRTYHASATANRYFRGLIDEVAFYERALSPEEIGGIYAAGDRGKCKGAPFTNFSAAVSIVLGANANDDTFELRGTATQGPGSDGLSPISEDLFLRLGRFSLVMPAGSFAGEPPRFKGILDGIKIEATLSSTNQANLEFRIRGSGADLSGIVSPAEIELVLGDNGAVAVLSETQIKGKVP